MIKMLAILGLVTMSLTAGASGFELPKSSTIQGAELFCANKGGMFAINSAESKVWQGDLGDPVGIELTDVKVNRVKCPGCLEIKAVLMGEIDVVIFVSGIGDQARAIAKLTTGKETETIGDYVCTATNQRR